MLLIFVRCAGRGDSAICTAPPPMIAPPQAQAHNLAKAIRTDIFDTLFVLRGDQVPHVTHPISSSAEEPINRNGINRDSAEQLNELAVQLLRKMVNVTFWSVMEPLHRSE